MSDSPDDFFALPPFKPSEALVQLKRSLRELRGLGERQAGFDWKGLPVIEIAATETALEVGLAKRPQRTPDWERRTLKSSADVRRFTDDVKRQVARWKDADD